MRAPALPIAVLLLFSAPLAAQEPDPDAIAGMNAEVRGDWLRAIEAFTRSAERDGASGSEFARLREAKQRAEDWWAGELEALIKARRVEDLPVALALAAAVAPRHHMVVRARKLVERAGLAVPELPAESAGAVPEYPLRSPGGRLRTWIGPASPRAEAIVDRCLDWLVRGQAKDGNWDAKAFGASRKYDSGVTGLALLALLARGPAELKGRRGPAIERAARYLLSAQAEDGSFKDSADNRMYCTAFAAEALAEFAVVAGRRERVVPALAKARDYLVAAQTPKAGWRYDVKDKESDTSMTGRVVCAFDRMRRAGVEIPHRMLSGARRWVDSMTDEEFGQVGYNEKGGLPARPEGKQARFPPERSQSMTSAGCLVNLYAGRDAMRVGKGLALIRQTPPSTRSPDFYYWDLGARALQACYGTVPRDWYGALVESARACVSEDGGVGMLGPWSAGGRVYATAACVLALTAPYREPAPAPARTWSASGFLEKEKRTVYVYGSTATGIYLDAGFAVKVAAAGGVVAWEDGPPINPFGVRKPPKGLKPLTRKGEFACLLGRVGPGGRLFAIKNGAEVRSRTPGQLYLLVNDRHPEDNAEGWKVLLELVK